MSNSYLSDYVDRLGDEEILITPDNAKDSVPPEPGVKEEESKDSAPNQPDQQSESSSKEEEQPKQEEKKNNSTHNVLRLYSIPSGGPPVGTHTQELWYSLRGTDAGLQSVSSKYQRPCDACRARFSTPIFVASFSYFVPQNFFFLGKS